MLMRRQRTWVVRTWAAVILGVTVAGFGFATLAVAFTPAVADVSSQTGEPGRDKGQMWTEPAPVQDSATGFIVGLADATERDAFLACVNQVQYDGVHSGSARWDFTSCDMKVMATCKGAMCTGAVQPDLGSVTFTLFDVSNNGTAQEVGQTCGNQDLDTCYRNAGCGVEIGDNDVRFITCPYTMTQVGSLVVDMAAWRDRFAGSPNSSDVSRPQPTGPPWTYTASAVNQNQAPEGSWSQPTVLSDVRLLGTPAEEVVRVAATAAASVVLIILVLLPTQLINSTLEGNADRIRGWFRRRRAREDKAHKAVHEKRRRVPQSVWGIPVLIAASLITGFADPHFGINAVSVRLFITLLATFLVLNYVGTFLVWLALRRRSQAARPEIRVHYLYLVIIAVTVVLSRLLHFEPALVFGVVLSIEATRVASSAAEQVAEDKAEGRIEFAAVVVTAGLGLVAWLIYNAVTFITLSQNPAMMQFASRFGTSIQEVVAALTIEALTSLPIVLLPLRFMPGATIFRWSKVAWGVLYGAALTAFIFVLLPLPNSWATVSASLTTWLIALGGYVVFAVVFWLAFRLGRHSSREHSEGTPAH